jgi:heme-binding protein
MQINTNVLRRRVLRLLTAGALAGLAAGTVAVPTASAQADCTAAGLSSAIGSVGAQTGQYFASHPDANEAVTNAGGQGTGAESAIRSYFVAHPQQWAELQRIAQPLRALRQQCEVDVVPADIARLFDAMAS